MYLALYYTNDGGFVNSFFSSAVSRNSRRNKITISITSKNAKLAILYEIHSSLYKIRSQPKTAPWPAKS